MNRYFLYTVATAMLGIALIGCKKGKEVTLVSIAVTTEPTKKEYFFDEPFNPAGIVVTATYSDKTTKQVNVTEAMLGYDFKTEGTNKTVTITYEGKTATVTVTVILFAGSGTNDSPYQIGNPAQLAKLAELVNTGKWAYIDKYYKLTDNISLLDYGAGFNGGKGWIPVGNNYSLGNCFSGNFDGANFTVSNLYINSTGSEIGLFGCVSFGTITNLSIVDADITGGASTGGVAGRVRGDGSTTNCYVTGSISFSGNGYPIGGVVGAVSLGSNVTNCYSAATVSGNDAVGGVVGFVGGGSVSNCYATGVVSGNDAVGGVVGIVRDGGNISNCAALNPSIKRTSGTYITFGRVAGEILSGNGTLSDNVAWDGISALGGITFGAGAHDNENGADITTEQAKQQATYEALGWNFTTVWKIEEGAGYPKLVWE